MNDQNLSIPLTLKYLRRNAERCRDFAWNDRELVCASQYPQVPAHIALDFRGLAENASGIDYIAMTEEAFAVFFAPEALAKLRSIRNARWFWRLVENCTYAVDAMQATALPVISLAIVDECWSKLSADLCNRQIDFTKKVSDLTAAEIADWTAIGALFKTADGRSFIPNPLFIPDDQAGSKT